MSKLIEDRLRASIVMDAVNGDRSERAICARQMLEAANVIAQYRAGVANLLDALGIAGTPGEDVFTLAVREIKRLREQFEDLYEGY